MVTNTSEATVAVMMTVGSSTSITIGEPESPPVWRLSENQMPNRGFGLLQGVAELGDERHDGAANRGADGRVPV